MSLVDIVSSTLNLEIKSQGKQPSDYPVEIQATEPVPVLVLGAVRPASEKVDSIVGELRIPISHSYEQVQIYDGSSDIKSVIITGANRSEVINAAIEELSITVPHEYEKVQVYNPDNPAASTLIDIKNTLAPTITHKFFNSKIKLPVETGIGGLAPFDIDGVTYTQKLSQVGFQIGPVSGGNETFSTPGTHSWTCPAGVSSVCVVAVGAGGSGGYQWSSGGGGGGGLGWKNNISVTAGQSYTVVVGDKGSSVANAYNSGGQGGNSYFIDTSTVCGFGAGRGGLDYSGQTQIVGHGAYGGGYAGDGGGAGGNGAISGSWTHGGGGAGGYSGDGASRHGGTSSSGGSGGAGQYYSSTYGVGAGGGVGLFGEGTSGDTYANGTGYGGRGGSGGGDGMAGETSNSTSTNIWERTAYLTTTGNNQILGGQFGGGGGGSGTSKGGGYGGTGAVRIVWGSNVAFPSTNTGEIPTVGNTESTLDVAEFSYASGSDPVIKAEVEREQIQVQHSYDGAVGFFPVEKEILVGGGTSTINSIMNKIEISSDKFGPNLSGYRPVSKSFNVGQGTAQSITPIINRIEFQVGRNQSAYAGLSSNIASFTYEMFGNHTFGFFDKGNDHTDDFFAEINNENDPRLLTLSIDPATIGSGGGEGGGGGGGEGTGPVQTWT